MKPKQITERLPKCTPKIKGTPGKEPQEAKTRLSIRISTNKELGVIWLPKLLAWQKALFGNKITGNPKKKWPPHHELVGCGGRAHALR